MPLPTSIADLALWFRGSDLVGLSDGQAVTAWTSAVGTSVASQGTGANQPTKQTVNGSVCVRFDGTNDILHMNGDALTCTQNKSGITLFVRVKQNGVLSATGYFIAMSNGLSTGSNRAAGRIEVGADKYELLGRRLDADTLGAVVGTVTPGTSFVRVFSGVLDYTNTDAFIFIDGAPGGSNLTFQTAGVSSNTPQVGASLGAEADNLLFLPCDIYEVLVYSRALTTAERHIAEDYVTSNGLVIDVDPSSPPAVEQTNNTTQNATTASFTPPAGSILVVGWVGHSQTGVNPAQPTITDSLGAPLTYTLSSWQSRADSPNVNGQAALWTSSSISTSAAMTVTVANQAASGSRTAALKVWVIAGADTAVPVGAGGSSGSASAATVTQNYTAQGNNSLGFIAVCDADFLGGQAPSTNCIMSATGTISSAFSYGFARRRDDDGASGQSNTLAVTLSGTSTDLNWAYAEIMPVSTPLEAGSTTAVIRSNQRLG